MIKTLIFVFSLLPAIVQAQQTIEIAGTGDSQSLLREIAVRFQQKHPDLKIRIPDSIGSGGGIKGLLRGKYVIVRTARALKESEQNGNLVEYPFALSPVVVTTNPADNNVRNISSEQFVDVYTGKINRWDQLGGPVAPIYPVDREPGDSSRSVLENKIKIFKEKTSTAKVFYTTPETVDAIADHQYTIGYLPMGLAHSKKLNILSINGVSPSVENIRKKSYPYYTTFYLVTNKNVPAIASKFIEFVYSDEAVKIIRERGLIPIDQKD